MQAVEEALDAALSDGLKPTLAVVFVAVAHDLGELAKAFAARDVELVAATSSGEFEGDEVFEDAVVGLLMELDRDSYHVVMCDGEGKTSRDVGVEIGRAARAKCEEPGMLLFSAGMTADGEQLARGVLETAGREAPVFGGLAGDDLQLHRTSVLHGERVCHNGALALVLDQRRVEMRGIASSGWRPVGALKVVTRSEGNLVYEIDGTPAIEVYKGILQNTGTEDGMIETEVPLLVYRDDGSAVVRTAMMTDHKRGALVFAGTVRQGASVRFASPPGFEITEHALSEVTKFRDEESPEADAVIVASCKGRHLALGPMMEDEVEALHELWDKPTVGFFSFGEIGRLPGATTDFHNNTFSLVTLKERA